MTMTELRATVSTAAINDLDDSAFAYIEAGGEKDDDGKTTPRSLRHYPVQDKAHADNALARADAAVAGEDADAKKIATAALPKIKAAVAKFADAEQKAAAQWDAQYRAAAAGMSYSDMQDMLSTAISSEFRPADLDDDDYWYSYVCDFTDTTVVFSAKGEKFQCDYALDGTTVTLGDATPVRAKTVYLPIEVKSQNPATPKRAFSSLIENPPAHAAQIEVRMAAEDSSDAENASIAHFTGYASATGVSYEVRDWLGEYSETMQPGSFAKTLREQANIPLLFNHDGIPLASTDSSTSRLAENKIGLRNEADFDRRDALSNSVCVQLSRGVLSKMSFSFQGVKDSWNDSYDERSVTEARLFDTSIVTYPANPATSGELVEAMRSALGREGRSLWVAEHELSVRSALPLIAAQTLSDDGDELLERALRALTHADEVVCRSLGRQHGRARTFHVASAILELRAGKTLSAANQKLLSTALDALAAADKQHAKLQKSHAQAADAVSNVLNGADSGSGAASGDGTSNGTPPGSGNPINPQDGAGPRSAALKLQREREAELRALRQH